MPLFSKINVYPTPEILAKEMAYLPQVILKNNYPHWMIQEPEKKLHTPIINPDTGLELKKNIFIPVLYVHEHRTMNITTHLSGILPCYQLPSVRTFYFKV